MNSLTLRAVAAELAAVRGRRVEGVASPEPLVLRLALEGHRAVVLGQDPRHPTLYLTAESPPPSGTATPFARGVERALMGSRLGEARQAGLDRVVALAFERRDRLGDLRTYHLVGEFLGAGGNLYLVQGSDPWPSKVLETLRASSHGREPGSGYDLPDPEKPDAAAATERELAEALRATIPSGDIPEPKHLVAAWAGMSPLVAREVLHRAAAVAGNASPGPEQTAAAWLAFLEDTRPPSAATPAGAAFHPTVLDRGPRGVEALCFRPETRTDADFPRHESVSAAAEAAHGLYRQRQEHAPHARLARLVAQAARRVDHALEQIGNEGREEDDPDRLRRTGEAILASAHRLQKGLTGAEIPDPAGDGTLTVRLNPKLPPAANAELYFKRARKAERRQGRSGGRRRELETRRRALGELGRDLDRTGPTPEWLRQARSLGVKVPVAPTKDMPPEEKLVSSLRPRRYDLGGGWELLVGKNNRGNEVLTLEIARPDDTWMHASQASGSHVVLRHHEKGKEPPVEVLRIAAQAAAFFSKSRNSSKVPVTVTRKRYVRKPRKVPVGTVTVGQHKTLMVAPRDPGREKETA